MTGDTARSQAGSAAGQVLSPGRLGQIACLLEVTARKPGNVHRFADLPGLQFSDFLSSATAIAEPLDRAATAGIGRAVYEAIEATRRVVSTNTNLGILLLLAPLAAVATDVDLQNGIEAVLAATTVEDARWVYRAIRLAEPGGLGDVPEQDVQDEPTVTLRAAMALAAGRDLIARQYADGYRAVFDDALPALQRALGAGQPLETAIIAGYLNVLAHHPDSLVVRKHGLAAARSISDRAAELLDAGWPDSDLAQRRCRAFDAWLRQPSHRFNPGTSADLVTAALFAALRDGTIGLPAVGGFPGLDQAVRSVSGTRSRKMVSVSNDLLTSLAERIVQLAHPRQVILFGSQARGTAREGSDLDLLIIGDRSKDEPWSRRREIGRIRRGLPSVGLPIDLLLFTPEEVEQWRHTTNHVVSEAMREGIVLYERP